MVANKMLVNLPSWQRGHVAAWPQPSSCEAPRQPTIYLTGVRKDVQRRPNLFKKKFIITSRSLYVVQAETNLVLSIIFFVSSRMM